MAWDNVIVNTPILMFLLGLIVLYFISGLGILTRRRWARVAAIIAVIPGLLYLPFGTALGIYGLWLLTGSDASRAWAEYTA